MLHKSTPTSAGPARFYIICLGFELLWQPSLAKFVWTVWIVWTGPIEEMSFYINSQDLINLTRILAFNLIKL